MAQEQNSIQTALEQGEIELQGQFLLGSNYTFLVRVEHAGRQIPAVYKPRRGEQPLWDFPPASLAGREVAAWLVSEALGWGFVPPTVLRDGPFGPGSLQQFIEYNPDYHFFNFKPADRRRLRPVALFDLLVNNADRKGSHVLVQKRTRRLFAIDHGLCFHAEDKLRTVIWDFAGQPVPAELLADLAALRAELCAPPGLGPDSEVSRLREVRLTDDRSRRTPSSGLSAALQAYLNPDELSALEARLGTLIANPVFPGPPEDRRAFPYPPL